MDQYEIALVHETMGEALARTAAADLPATLLESGWQELAADDPLTAVGALFEQQGRVRAASPALDLVALGALGLPLVDDLAVVYPAVERGDRFGESAGGGGVSVDGLVLAGSSRARAFVVPVLDAHENREADERTSAAVTVVDAQQLGLEPVSGFDPDLCLQRISGRLEAWEPLPSVTPDLAEVASACQLALAHELLGVSEALLALTAEHVTARSMFGRSLGSFQSVQHRVADLIVAVTSLREALHSLGATTSPLGGRVGKALAGRTAVLAARTGQQLTGAIGFTEEHPLPGLLRRAYALDALLGSSRLLQIEIGNELLAVGSATRLFPI